MDYQFARVLAFLSKSVLTHNNTNKTAYNLATAKLNLKSGVVNNPSFEMDLPKYKIKGNGYINMRNEKISYRLGIKALNAIRIKTPVTSTNLADYYIPLSIGGTISNPKPSLDLPGIATITLKEAAKEVITRQITNGEILGKVIKEPVKEIIKLPVGETLKKVLPFGRN